MARATRERRTIVAVYKRSAQSNGAVGARALKDEQGNALKLPAGSKVVGARLEGVTTLTSGGLATVALGITGNTDALKAATAFDNAAFAGTAYTEVENEVPFEVGGTAVDVLATVAVAALTAGEFRVELDLVV